MKRRTWQVWKEITGEGGIILEETILFEGSYTNALKFYKQNGGERAGLHLGYPLGE